jgi:uncharacterized alpha-E superfamily protein
MISRVAESCFWLTRYMERAETMARLLDVTETARLDGSLSDTDQWRPIVIVCGEEKSFLEHHSPESMSDAEAALSYLTWNAENPSSIYTSLRWARENMRTIRETASLEMWETINELWLWLRSRSATRLYQDDRHSFYIRLRERCMLFEGLRHATMLHETAYDFMQMGAYLERVSQTARVLDVKYHSLGPDRARPRPVETAQWLAALRCCSAVEPFFKRAANELEARTVAGFLLFDPAFPRTVRHNLDRAALRLDAVRSPENPDIGRDSAAIISDMIARLDTLTIESAIEGGLHELLTWIVDRSAELCGQIRDDFFEWEPEIVRESAAR